MGCMHVTLADGFTAIICGVKTPGPCSVKGCNNRHTKLCDYPVGKNKTCDRKLCDRHAESIGEDRDVCPEHSIDMFFAANAGEGFVE